MFDIMFGIVPVFFFITFAIAIGIFVMTFVNMIKTWNKNNNSPRLTVTATVITKRDQLHSHHHTRDLHHRTTHSHTYFATFQFESGDRLELIVPSNEYGLLAEGDVGQLTFQGTRFLSFTRT